MAFSVDSCSLPVCSLLISRSKLEINSLITPIASLDNRYLRNISHPLILSNTFGHYKIFPKYTTKNTIAAVSATDIPPATTEDRFSLSLWDEALFTPDYQAEEKYAKDVEEFKKKVRRMILDEESEWNDKMILIDLIQRLGVGHHFKQEIEDQIQHIYQFQAESKETDSNLLTTALQFRLFRQHGIDVPSSVFNKFKDESSGTFKETLCKDIKGLLSFYEATHLRYQGEDILKEGNAFATHHLKEAIPQLDSHLQEHVTRALHQPVHWGHPRIEARNYISFYEKEKTKNELLLKFAKMDFNMVQNLYKHKISMLLRWWKRLNLRSKLPYIRDTMVESYFWAMTTAFEPQLSFARVCAAKAQMLFVVMNDTIDGYEELENVSMFFKILQQSMDVKQIDWLPEGLRTACKAILNTFEELDEIISRQGRPYAVPWAREAMKNIAICFLRTAMWCNGCGFPTFYEMISYGHDDTACIPVTTACLIGMESASKEAFKWLLSASTMARACGLYVRCTNNIASYEREQGIPGTAIDCYMKEQQATKEEAMAKLHELAEDALMTINQEWVSTKNVPKDIMCRPVNYARSAYVSYSGGFDGYTNPGTANVLKDDMASVFIHPITID